MKNVFVHPAAMLDTTRIGSGTRIWEQSHVMKGARVGRRCNICAGSFIENGAVVGDNVVIKNGVCVWKGVTIEDGAFIGSGAVLTNEREPRSGFPKALARTRICQGATIGAGAVLVAPVKVGRYATVGAGAVVTRDVPDFTLVFGNPAKPRGFMCVCGRRLNELPKKTKTRCVCGARVAFQKGKVKVLAAPRSCPH
ncbi:MAG: N-acetyltransferase [Lentisphaerae bacterium]|nr:N-acetyltransferase [Lentisphaerota bacterium]